MNWQEKPYPYPSRKEKELFLKQKAVAVWFTGLPASGKSTIAFGLEKILAEKGFFTRVLDGDEIRNGINKNLGFSEDDRYENIRRIAEVNRLFTDCGIITINAFVSPSRKIRAMARKIIGQDDFIEVFVNTSLETCIKRDPKGLYHKAMMGEIKNFTGLDAPYEVPENAALVINTENITIKESVDMAYRFLIKKIQTP